MLAQRPKEVQNGWWLAGVAVVCLLAIVGGSPAGPRAAWAHDGDDHDHEHGEKDHAKSDDHAHGSGGGHGEGGGNGHHELTHADAGPQLEAAEEWRADLAIFTFVVFVLLTIVLTKFAWGPISAALDRREKTIEDHLASAQQQHEEAKLLLAQYDQKLAAAAEQVRALLEEARRDAEHTKGEIIAEAKAASDAERARAIRDVELAKDSALHEIAKTTTQHAVLLAQKMVSRVLTPEEHARLIRESIDAIPSQN